MIAVPAAIDLSKPWTVTADWSAPAIALAALMRRHGMTELHLTEEELNPEGGMIIDARDHVELQ